MPKVLNAQQTSDQYTPQNTVQNVYESKGGWIVLAGQVFAQQQLSDSAQQGSETFGEEFLLPSGAHYLEPGTIGLRVRSATTGLPVLFTISLFYKYDNAMVLGGAGISNPNPGVAALNFQHNDIAVATEPTADFEDAAGGANLVWTVVDDPANTRVKITPVWQNPTIFPNEIQAPSMFATGFITAFGIFSERTLANQVAFEAFVSGDAFGRLDIAANGALNFGPGNTATNAQLGWSNPGALYLLYPPLGNPANTSTFFVDQVWAGTLNNTSLSFGCLLASLTTDAIPRFQVNTDGTINWGTGASNPTDTTLNRVSAGLLQVGNAFTNGPTSNTYSGTQTTGWITSASAITFFNTVAFDWVQSGRTTDTVRRFSINDSGLMQWGNGSASQDSALQRTGAGRIQLSHPTGAADIRLDIVPLNTNTVPFSIFIVGDTQPRIDFRISSVVGDGATMEWGAGNAAADITLARKVNSPTGTGTFFELIQGSGFGYGAGTGGAVTQATSRTTAVTLNKPSGQITTNTTSLANGAQANFTVNNSVVGLDDTVILTIVNLGSNTLPYSVTSVGTGNFTIQYTNNTGLATTTAYIFNFAIIKGAVT